jgi:putative resolvase
MEHKDRLTRSGYNHLEPLLKMQDRRIEVIHLAKNGKEDLIRDLVSIVTGFCARPDGPRRSRHRTGRLIAELTPKGHE